MARKIKLDHFRHLTRTGRSGSISVVIPAEFIKALSWRERQRVLVKKVAGAIIIRDARTKKKK